MSTFTPEPLISIIVPVYNTSRWLKKCMDSICNQTYKKLQIIAVDDGSTDESLSILREYEAKDPRVEVIHQENAGLSSARNAGLRKVKGEWITGVDSDDYIAFDTYEILISKLLTEADIVCYGAQPVNEKGEKESLHIMDILLAGCYPSTPQITNLIGPTFQNKLWRRELIRKWELQFAPGLIHEDEILWKQACAVAKSIQLIPDKLYYYLQRKGSIMHSNKSPISKTQDYSQVICAVAAFYEKHFLHVTDIWRAHLAYSLGAFYDACLQLCTKKKERTYITQEFSILARQTNFGTQAADIYPIQELITPPNKLTKFFFKRAFNKKTYCFFGIPLWTIRIRKNKTTYRLIGIPIFVKKIKQQHIISQ